MSIYTKLAKARVQLQEKGLAKSGKNQKFKYFELKDFLPEVNRIFEELNMCAVISYTQELATLTIYDGEKDEKIVFTSPMVQKALPSGTEIQNLGAIQTYQRRYLYLTALEIAESDAVDCLDTSKESPEPNDSPKPKSPASSNNSTPRNVNSTPAKSTPRNASSTPAKSTFEQLKDGLRECKNKKELEERYAKQMPWIEQKHPELIDDYNSFYDECLFNLNV